MKQAMGHPCDAFMPQIGLALPKCEYKHDSDELLKDQFIFGLQNKKFQDHLLGELSETDNSVRAFYEVCRVESKLEQRKMLGIITPSAVVGIDAVKQN